MNNPGYTGDHVDRSARKVIAAAEQLGILQVLPAAHGGSYVVCLLALGELPDIDPITDSLRAGIAYLADVDLFASEFARESGPESGPESASESGSESACESGSESAFGSAPHGSMAMDNGVSHGPMVSEEIKSHGSMATTMTQGERQVLGWGQQRLQDDDVRRIVKTRDRPAFDFLDGEGLRVFGGHGGSTPSIVGCSVQPSGITPPPLPASSGQPRR